MTQVLLHHKTYIIERGELFSPAEARELAHWLQGMTVDESAALGRLSIETVKTHRARLRDKTGQHTGVGVMTFCLVYGYIRPDDSAPQQLRRNRLMYSLRAAHATLFRGGVQI